MAVWVRIADIQVDGKDEVMISLKPRAVSHVTPDFRVSAVIKYNKRSVCSSKNHSQEYCQLPGQCHQPAKKEFP